MAKVHMISLSTKGLNRISETLPYVFHFDGGETPYTAD